MAHMFETGRIQRRMLMGYEEVSRKLEFGGNWQRIRIGIRGRLVAPFAGTWSAQFAAGAFSSAGVGGAYLADRSEGWIGALTGTTIGANLNFAPTGSTLYAQWGGMAGWRRANITTTLLASATTAQFFSATSAIHSALIVDILKSTAGLWTVQVQAPSSAANALIDKTYAQFLNDATKTDATPTGYTNLSVAPTNPGAPFINKTLDMVSFAWTHSSIRFQLQNLVVVRVN